ncbi:MAG TPA: histidine kinase [Gemmatimonadaceae bacterium]|nr:histidine kinase [Gemmatimonadaceae bacterium]
MSPPPSPTRRWQPWLLGFGVWTVLGLLSAVQTSIYFMRDGRPVPWTPVLIDRLADWYTCAIFTPFFFWLVRAIPWERARWWRAVSVQTLVALACVPIKYLMYAGIVAWLIPDYRNVVVGRLIVGNFVSEFMAFAAMFAIIHAVEFNRRAMEDTARAARLETRLAEARLETLTAQLQPHFLFNTLHAISTLMHRDVEAADTMLARLGDLLRRTLDGRDRPEVPLAEELRLLDAYLDIARVRFEDRLTVDVSIATETNDALVPRFVLQPLVENALQHGIGSRQGRGRVTIQATRDGERLRLSVADDGLGAALQGNGFPREGMGLTNTRERLRERYGTDHSLQLTKGGDGGLLVAVDIPFRTAPA